MKLAFVNFYSGLADRGGEVFVDILATRLAKNININVYQAGKSEKKPYSVISKSIKFNSNHPHSKLPTTHILKRLFLDYFSIKILVFTLKIIPDLIKQKPDYIYVLNSGWELLLLTIVSRIYGFKIIVGSHSGPGWNDRINLLLHPDVFVALTNYQFEWARKVSPWKNQKITIIPNGVDTTLFTPNGENRIVNLPHPIVLAVGAAIKSKRISLSIKAVSKLKTASFMVAGTGPDEETEDMLGEKLLGSRYKRIKVTHSEMPSVYRACDVFTLCSDGSEASPLSYLEALASGLTCVATDDASRRWILGDVGIFVKDPEYSKEYAEKLQEALKRKDTKRNINQAKKYSWANIADKYEKILDNKESPNS